MTENEWLACGDAREMILSGTLDRAGGPRKLRLLAVACCRCSRQLMRNTDHRRAVDVAERFADGHATEGELVAAYQRTDEYARGLHDGESEREIRRWSEAVAVLNAVRLKGDPASDAVWQIRRAAHRNIDKTMVALLRDIFGNPFRPVALAPSWLTTDVLALARGVYDERAFDRMPILADALQDAGYTNDDLLTHCRDTSLAHVRGCWAVDLVLGKS